MDLAVKLARRLLRFHIEQHLFLIVSCGICVHAGQAANDANGGGSSTFTDVNAKQVHDGFYDSITAVNFKNFLFSLVGYPEGKTWTFRLRGGSYEESSSTDHVSAELIALYPLSAAGSSAPNYALALLGWQDVAGSSSQGEVAQIYALEKNHPVMIQQIGWDTRYGALPARRCALLRIRDGRNRI